MGGTHFLQTGYLLLNRNAPYVCNGCSQLPKCTLLKRIYDPADAHEMAHQSISESRTGIFIQ